MTKTNDWGQHININVVKEQWVGRWGRNELFKYYNYYSLQINLNSNTIYKLIASVNLFIGCNQPFTWGYKNMWAHHTHIVIMYCLCHVESREGTQTNVLCLCFPTIKLRVMKLKSQTFISIGSRSFFRPKVPYEYIKWFFMPV